MSLENTRTQKNLMTAFFRESGAAIEYNFYANQAKKDGYEQIANTFNDFAIVLCNIFYKTLHFFGIFFHVIQKPLIISASSLAFPAY